MPDASFLSQAFFPARVSTKSQVGVIDYTLYLTSFIYCDPAAEDGSTPELE
jgi:hypothetical protein